MLIEFHRWDWDTPHTNSTWRLDCKVLYMQYFCTVCWFLHTNVASTILTVFIHYLPSMTPLYLLSPVRLPLGLMNYFHYRLDMKLCRILLLILRKDQVAKEVFVYELELFITCKST